MSLLINNKYNRLAKLMEQAGILPRDRFKEVMKKAKAENRQVTEILLADRSLSQEKVLEILSGFFNVPVVSLKKRMISRQVLNLIPKEIAEQHSVIIFKKIKKTIQVATTEPDNTQILRFIRQKTGFEPEIFLTTPQDISLTLQKYHSEISEEFAKIIQDSTQEALATNASAEKLAQYVPIIKMVNNIIDRALTQNASDIHLQPSSDKIIIRFRIDGLLQQIVELPKEILPALIARIKIIANLKIDEHRRPQDSRFSYVFNEREVAIRVSIIPTLHGSKIVLRLLDMEQKKFTLRRLGLNKRDFAILKNEIFKPHGMILVTGPTGSGKTTTLYTILHLLNNEDVNICTIEDPVEYGINGINQTQINTAANLIFANGLRSLLRQDPNILMVGEIRDSETADISINAAMTGHLVLSTLHTNNAFLAPQRLIEMGLSGYLVAPVVNLIIGQRLVRKICPQCRITLRSTDKILETYGSYFEIKETFNKLKKMNLLTADQKTFKDIAFFRGRGCSNCNNTGYHGRIGIYEVVKAEPALRKIILTGADPNLIKKQALAQGTLTMTEDGLLKVFNGRTTFDEILRVTKD